MERDPSLRGADARKAHVATMCAMFDHAVETAPDNVALRHFGAVLTYRELGRAVAALASSLAAMVDPGDVAALVLPNSIDFPVAYFAALKARAAPALLNPLYPAAQLSPLLREASPRVVLCGPATKDIVAGLARDLSIPGVICLGQDVTVQELARKAAAPVGPRTAVPGDPGVLLFSGGTTGLPKAVEHTHARLVAAVRYMEAIWPTRNDSDVFLPIAPFTHVYGFLQGVLVPLSARGETVIPETLSAGAHRRAARASPRDLLRRRAAGHLCGGAGGGQS